MRTADFGPDRSKPANCAYAAIIATFLALVVGFGLTLLITHYGLGTISSPQHKPNWSRIVPRSALSYYASLHVPVEGSGVITDVFGEKTKVSAAITIPLGAWALIPALGLFVGGYAAGRMRRGCGRTGMIAPVLIGAIIYSTLLACCAPLVSGMVDRGTLPAVKGLEFSPPQIPFSPSQDSTMVFGGIFAFIFLYLGAVAAVRVALADGFRARWWNCAKGVLFTAVPLQILLATGLMAWYFTSVPRKDAPGLRFAQLLPSVSGIAYLAAYGADIRAGVESIASSGYHAYPFRINANIYKGIQRHDMSRKPDKPIPHAVFVLVALAALCAFISGWLAVRLGSKDGSLPTALRTTVIHTAYLGLLMLYCGIQWRVGEAFSTSIVRLAPVYTATMLYSLGGILFFSFFGAFLAGRKYTSLSVGW